jgi:NIMA (never in mitosis gene a)-related kinase 1/4/5
MVSQLTSPHLASGGDLETMIGEHKPAKYMSEGKILNYFTQIILALKHVHDKKILHRDLKGSNVFLTSKGFVKLGDFGVAKALEKTKDMAATVVGTPYYLSPEIVQAQPYDYKTDVWSLGIILYEMCALTHPFNGTNLHTLALQIVSSPFMPLPSHYSQEMKDLVGSLL